jgi:hypothetical protein
MSNPNQRSAAVVASGVIAIIGSLLAAIGVLIGTAGLLFAPIPRPRASVPGVRSIAMIMMAVFFAIAIWGIISGVGLLRFRNWARMSVLVWSGMTTPLTLVIIGFFLFVPFPSPPGSSAAIGTFLRAFVILFYGAPLAIAIWWLILLTRAHIVAQFKSTQFKSAAAFPIEGDPALGANASVWSADAAAPGAYPVPPPMPAPDLPIPIIVLACFFLFSSVSFVMVFFTHVPAMLFGMAIDGPAGLAVYVGWFALYVSSGVGMLKRAVWSYSIAIGLQIFGLVSGVVTVLSPNFDAVMRRVLSNANLPSPEATFPSMTYLRGFTLLSLVFPLAILGMLVYYRPRFLAAAAGAAQQTP